MHPCNTPFHSAPLSHHSLPIAVLLAINQKGPITLFLPTDPYTMYTAYSAGYTAQDFATLGKNNMIPEYHVYKDFVHDAAGTTYTTVLGEKPDPPRRAVPTRRADPFRPVRRPTSPRRPALPSRAAQAEPRRPARAALPNPSRAALPHSPAPSSRPAATTAATAARATAAAGGGAAGSARGAAGARSAGGAAGAGGAGPTTDRHCLSWPLSRQLQRLGVDSSGHCLSPTTPPLSGFVSGLFSKAILVVEVLVLCTLHSSGSSVRRAPSPYSGLTTVLLSDASLVV
ncbi:unnamed protein product [Closterium sp. NIES-53]